METEEAKFRAASPWHPEHSPRKIAILGKTLEELGELTAIIARCLIQGIEESEPTTNKPNRQALEDEIADVHATLARTIDHFNLDTTRIGQRAKIKMSFTETWLDALPD